MSVPRAGVEPCIAGLKGRHPEPLDERGMSAHTTCTRWIGRRSNPRLRFFKPPLYHLSYRSRFCMTKDLLSGQMSPEVELHKKDESGTQKKPDVVRDTGL